MDKRELRRLKSAARRGRAHSTAYRAPIAFPHTDDEHRIDTNGLEPRALPTAAAIRASIERG